jgi:tetratricopeptide (TPR) repeat protein
MGRSHQGECALKLIRRRAEEASIMELRDQLQGTLGAAYSLEQELGGGGMSRVFVARETALGRSVVVKVLPPDLVGGVNMDRFRREIKLAASLQHPHIVPVLSAGEMSGVPYYTMPLVEGSSLRARLRDFGALPMAEALGIMLDVAKALAYAHAHGVVHRDIKPDNILLSGGTAVVTDFGIAKAISESTREAVGNTLTSIGTSVGTPAYMAPEQAAADPGTDHRADIYSFGCMAYEMLAGRPPFVETTPQRLIAAQLSRTPTPVTEFRADVPPALAALLMQCLEKDPANRPQQAADLVHVIEAAAAHVEALPEIPAALLVPVVLGKAMALYVVIVIAVALAARASIAMIGLPEWVLPGALIVMALGVPVVMLTALVHYSTRRAATESPASGGERPASSTALDALVARATPHVSWRRTTKGGLLALGAFVLLVTGFMSLRALGIGPAGSLLAAGKLRVRDRIVVGDFRMSGGDSSLGRVVTEAVRTGLSESPLFTIVAPTQIAGALRRMQREPTTWVDLALAREIAQREGAKAVVTGDITPLAAGYVVTLRLVSADSGAELASFHETADAPHDLLPTLDQLTRRLRGKAGESLKNVHAAPPLEQVTTTSLYALRRYADGARAHDAGDAVRAIESLQQAIALDSTFAMAYRKLASAYRNAQYPVSWADSASLMAYRFRDHLPERERGIVTGDYFARGPGHDRSKGIAAYQALLARYPDDVAAINNLALAYQSRRERSVAESLYARGMALDSSVELFWSNLLTTYTNQKEYAEGNRMIQQIRRRFPGNRSSMLFIAFHQYGRGDRDSAAITLDSLRVKGSGPDRAAALGALASLALARGRIAETRALLKERATIDPSHRAPSVALDDVLLDSFLDIWVGEQPARGIVRMDSALATTPIRSLGRGQEPSYSMTPGYNINTPYFTVATNYALANQPARARAVLAQYDADVRDTAWRRFLEPRYMTALGEVLLAEQRPLEALAAFRRGDMRPDGPANACGACLPIRAARAFDRAGMSDSAIVMFEQFLAAGDAPRMTLDIDGTFLAGTYKRLGELYDAKGDRARAAEYSGRFVALWKRADRELQPRVADVQRRLAKLGGIEGVRSH